ncbi:hypothetical protein ASL83_003326 [Vibrio parahaemolyticus]|nr:hypothetical protein [Vibrio parahaemolyticus]
MSLVLFKPHLNRGQLMCIQAPRANQVKKGIHISIIDGAQEAIKKKLLPEDIEHYKFEAIVKSASNMFDCNGLLFTNKLNESVKIALSELLPEETELIDLNFNAQLVGNKRQFASSLIQFNLRNGNVEQEISLHAVFRKV